MNVVVTLLTAVTLALTIGAAPADAKPHHRHRVVIISNTDLPQLPPPEVCMTVPVCPRPVP